MGILRYIVLVSCFFVIACGSDSWFGFDKKVKIAGERLPVVEKSRDLEVNPSLMMQEILLPPAINITRWNHDNVDSNNSNFALHEVTGQLSVFNFSSSSNLIFSSRPLIIDGVIYILDSDGRLSAYNFTDGEKLWDNYIIEKQGYYSVFNIFKDRFISGGLKYANGKIFITSGITSVICINATTGEQVWSVELSSPSRSIPQIYEDMLFVQTIDNRTFALNIADGHIIWSNFGTQDDVNTLTATSLLLDKNQLIVHHSSDELHSLDALTGEEIWDENIAANKGVVNTSSALINFSNHPILDNAYVFAANNHGVLAKIDADSGQSLWRKDLKLVSDILIYGQHIYAMSQNNKLIAVDKITGGVRWLVDLNQYDKDGKKAKELQYTSPIMVNGNLLVLSNNGDGVFLTPTDGHEIKRIQVLDDIYLKPMVVDGYLIVVSNSGKIAKY